MVELQKRKIQWAISLLLVMLYFSGLTAQEQYGGGTGEPNDPYLIYTAEQMNAIGTEPNDWDKHFKLMADIDLAGYTGTDFNIIGYYRTWQDCKPFNGVFDGNGKKISNFSYAYTEAYARSIGLFGYVSGENAHIKDLGLIAPDFDAGTGDYVGSLVGYVGYRSVITNCYAEGGRVSGDRNVGGLVGYNYYGTITNCYSMGSVSGSYNVGGLVGHNDYYGLVTGCYSSGSVIGDSNAGGLVGKNEGPINGCYSMGSVSGDEEVGGLAGLSYAEITNCYASGSVSGNKYVGGLVGENGDYDRLGDRRNGTISNSYSVGSVSGDEWVGGLVGDIEWGTVTASFWDIQTSGQETSAGGTGKTTAEMQMESTFTGWGCEPPVWTIDEGADYPRLAWEKKPGDPLPALWEFLEGSGTQSDPYLIYTGEKFNMIGLFWCEWDKHFKLMADIDLSNFTGTDFNIIGIHWRNPFNGVFDGNGRTISNFSYTSTHTDSIGLFAYVMAEYAQIKDLGLIDPNIDAGTAVNVGSLVGVMGSGTITNCYVQGGNISGRSNVGGLVGENWRGTITNCYATGSVSGNDDVGGLVGYNDWDGTITNCYSSGRVSGGDKVGGLVGYNYGGTITNCSSSGSVSGDFHVGGLVGENRGTTTNCYATGDVMGNWYIGGLVGQNWKGKITNCYSVGNVTRTFHVGGLVGSNTDLWGKVGTATHSFWDIETSGQATSAGGTGKTTAEMQKINTFLDASWDFRGESANGTEDIWSICEGTNYPRLVWQIPAGDFVCPDGITIEDFLFFIEYWRDDNCDVSNDYCDGTDLDFSGTVDEADLEILVENWLAVGNDY